MLHAMASLRCHGAHQKGCLPPVIHWHLSMTSSRSHHVYAVCTLLYVADSVLTTQAQHGLVGTTEATCIVNFMMP
jgi:hypothetical protein